MATRRSRKTNASSSRSSRPVLPYYSNYIPNHQSLQVVPYSPVDMQQEYKCKYCSRVWATLRALCGHQNAHKKERAEERRRAQLLVQPLQPISIQPLAAVEGSNPMNGPNVGPSRVLYPPTPSPNRHGATQTRIFCRYYGNAMNSLPPLELDLFPRTEVIPAAAAEAETLCNTGASHQAALLSLMDRSENEELDLSLRL